MSETAGDPLRPWAPSIGLGIGVLVIGGSGWLLVRQSSDTVGVLLVVAASVVLALPAVGRWPLSRRRCAITAAVWLVLGFASWALFWVFPVFPLFVAPFAAMPALIGCGVGWD